MATKKKSPKRARTAKPDTQAQLINMLHQVWLAGLGAVARAQRGAPKLLDELVAEGAQVYADSKGAAEQALRGALSGVQETLNSRMGKVRNEAVDAFENLEKIFRARVHSALTQLGVPSAGEVESLSRRVDALNVNIDKLARTRKGTARARTARRNGSSRTSAH
jgi:poly(hydroxyalkanoate) granule-associated protein